MNTTWNYSNFNVYETYGDLQDVVYSYNYSVTVTDGISEATEYGFVRLNFAEIQNFTPFSSLTQQMVQAWTEQTIDTVSIITKLEEKVIAKNASVKTNLPPPWA